MDRIHQQSSVSTTKCPKLNSLSFYSMFLFYEDKTSTESLLFSFFFFLFLSLSHRPSLTSFLPEVIQSNERKKINKKMHLPKWWNLKVFFMVTMTLPPTSLIFQSGLGFAKHSIEMNKEQFATKTLKKNYLLRGTMNLRPLQTLKGPRSKRRRGLRSLSLLGLFCANGCIMSLK